jgi:8-oxo-dGTP diphosphatase
VARGVVAAVEAREGRQALTGIVRAAGGVVARRGPDGVEVLVVHRPRYDDWSFPKGKVEPGETDEECAVREVEEETGLVCVLEEELPVTEYVDARGRPKRVRYWLMHPVGGELAYRHEVDEARWLSPAAALELLSYPRDAPLLDGVT